MIEGCRHYRSILYTVCMWALSGFIVGGMASAEAPAELYLRGRYVRVLLLERDETQLAYRLPDAPAGVQVTVPLTDVEEAQFALEPYVDSLIEYVDAGDLVRAGRLLYRTVQPFIPFLDLPYNNAVEPAQQAAWYLIRTGRDMDDPRQARRFFQMAENIYRNLGQADWSPWSQAAQIRVAQCLLYQGEYAAAQAELDGLGTPAPRDGTYGLYWLVRGEWAQVHDDWATALAAATRSVAFESKDVGSFPDALLLSAQGFEGMGEYHRARDVYYEVARLFVGTEWAEEAVTQLHTLMESGQTLEAEEIAVEDVFFRLNQEDMNEVVTTFLEEHEQ